MLGTMESDNTGIEANEGQQIEVLCKGLQESQHLKLTGCQGNHMSSSQNNLCSGDTVAREGTLAADGAAMISMYAAMSCNIPYALQLSFCAERHQFETWAIEQRGSSQKMCTPLCGAGGAWDPWTSHAWLLE